MRNLSAHLFTPINASSIAFFRIAFGGILLWKTFDYFDQGRITRYWVQPSFNFKYSWFPWVTALPGDGMLYLFYGLGVLAFFVMVGFLYRPSVFLMGLGLAYTFLLEEARYLNHDYLVILLCLLLTFIPAHRHFSVDARLFNKGQPSELPAWCLWLLRFQIGVPYFFGGVAKLNADWLQGEPMRLWLSRRTQFPLIGPLFTEEWFVYLATYGGLLLDLLAVPLLLWSRTRPYTFAALVLFHFTNSRWFSIGIFPWLMIAATTLFFPPDWPIRLWQALKRHPLSTAVPSLVSGVLVAITGAWFYEQVDLPVLLVGFIAGTLIMATLLKLLEADTSRLEPPPKKSLPLPLRRQIVIGLLTLWVTVQVLLPFRHLIIPGDPSWTEEGHRFAWHMLLRTKQGTLNYLVSDPSTGQRTEIDPSIILAEWQISRLDGNPHMIHQFAHYIAKKFAEDGFESVEVRAIAEASLNGRDPQFLVSPTVNLAAEPLGQWHAEWIEALTQPLKRELTTESLSPSQKEQSD